MGSKKVFIKRNRPFIHEQLKSIEAQEYLSLSKRSIGSYFVNKNSTRKGTGLADEEVKLLLPQILDIRPDDMEFRKKVDNFYTEISTSIPYERGLELEIGLELDNDKPPTYYIEKEDPDNKDKTIKVYNMPIDIENYVRFRHAYGDPKRGIKGHPHVAGSPEEAKGNQTVDYFIEDPDRVMSSKVSNADNADKALSIYSMIKDEPDKIKMILTLLRGEIKKTYVGQVIIVDQMGKDDQRLAIRELALTKPDKFLKVAQDEKLKYKYQLDELLSVQLLKRAGTSILVTSSGEPLGVNDEDAVKNLFEDPARAPLVSQLKAQYKERKEKQRALINK